ncbi:tyrosine-type recombinase/integrase [Desulfobacula phenolica]
MSLEEVRKIIYALTTVQSHTFYLTLYSMGLRLREATTLQVKDILSDMGLVHIHGGKDALDRTVPLPKITLLTLRKYYKTHRNPKMVSSDFHTKTVKRKNGKPCHWMPWSLFEDFCSMFFPKGL